MANAEMYDYLSTITADYNSTLDIPSRVEMVDEGEKRIHIKRYDDESETRIVRSTTSLFLVRVQFPNITEANAGTIFDWYHDAAKACGMKNSFKWINYGEPVASRHTYVVRFASTVPRGVVPTYRYSMTGILLRVLGRIAD